MTRVWLIVGIGIAALAAFVFWLADKRPEALASEDDRIHLTYLVIILVLVGSGLMVRWRSLPALKWLKHGLIWMGLGLVLVVGYSFRTDLSSLWTRTVAEVMPGRAIEVAAGTAIVRSSDDRHFRVDAIVDGAQVRFLLDTGASMVVLTGRDAQKLGFDLNKLEYTQRTETANGVGMGSPVRLREIRVGPIVVKDIRAMINQSPMSNSLLGMSFLERLSGYSVEDGTLTLRQ